MKWSDETTANVITIIRTKIWGKCSLRSMDITGLTHQRIAKEATLAALAAISQSKEVRELVEACVDKYNNALQAPRSDTIAVELVREQEAFKQFKIDYAKPYGCDDIGEVYYWACYWHEQWLKKVGA